MRNKLQPLVQKWSKEVEKLALPWRSQLRINLPGSSLEERVAQIKEVLHASKREVIKRYEAYCPQELSMSRCPWLTGRHAKRYP